MKLSRHAFLRLWSVHAWTGVIAGLVLYVMFLAGGVTLFHTQLETWEEPLAQRAPARATTLQLALDRALAAKGETPDEFWFYPAANGLGAARIAYPDRTRVSWSVAFLDAASGKLVPQREQLAHFLYSLHFLWHERTGRWLYTCAGLLAVTLMLALTTGILIHLKDLVRQFHEFRPGRSRRIVWSDMHKVLGVMGLPFQLMYAYTGAFLVLGPWLLSLFTGPVFKGDSARAGLIAWGVRELELTPAGSQANVWSLDALAARAAASSPGLTLEGFRLIHHGRDNGVVEAWGQNSATPHRRIAIQMRELDGAITSMDRPGSSAAASGWLRGLHVAAFGGVWLRILFLLLTLAACATILTGNWIWLARGAAQPDATTRWGWLARLTVGVGAGSWVGLGALFCASRLLPLAWSPRGAVEELTFVAGLGACVAWALGARDEYALWWRQLALAALLFLPVPFLAARWSDAGAFGGGPHLGSVVAVDIGVLLTAFGLGTSAWLLRRQWLRDRVASQVSAQALQAAAGTRALTSESLLIQPRGFDA